MDLADYLSLYTTSVAFIIFPCIALGLLLFSDEPPSFPLHSQADPIDCHNIFPISLSVVNSRVIVSLAIGNFIEFPQNLALRLLHVQTQTGDIVMDHPGTQFWDLAFNGSNISFCILHPIIGRMRATVLCHARPLFQIEHTVEAIDASPTGFSRALTAPSVLVSMNDICFSNNTIHYFTHPPAIAEPMKAAFDHLIPYNIRLFAGAVFQMIEPSHASFGEPVIFVSAAPEYAWQVVTDVVLPLWNVVGGSSNRERISVYLTRNQLNIVKNIQRIMKGTVLLNTTNGCFSEAHFLKAPGSVPIDVESKDIVTSAQQAIAEHLAAVTEGNAWDIAQLKGCFTQETVKLNRIVLDSYMAMFAPRLQILFPTLDVVLLPDTDDLAKIADCVAQAMIYIAGHVTTLAFVIFLSPEAVVIEAQPTGLECTQFGRDWARFAKVKYLPMRSGGCTKCNASDLFCYLNDDPQYDEISLSDLKESVWNATGLM